MSEPLIIHGVTLIDGAGGSPIEHARIVIQAGSVTNVDQNSSAAIPEGAQAIDARGLWATPGLIDTHVHLSMVGEASLPLFLALGITTIRDLGGPLDFLAETRRLLEDGAVGPRLLYAGPFIDGDPPTLQSIEATAGPDAAARAVQVRLDAGADAIKLYSTLPPESVRRAIQAADHRVPVTGHLGTTLASDAMKAGINGLEHALATPFNDFAPEEHRTPPGQSWETPGFWQNQQRGWLKADFTSDKAKAWVQLVVERDVSFCPTLTLSPGSNDLDEEQRSFIRFAVVDQAAVLRRSRARSFQPSPDAVQLARQARGRLQELVGLVHEAGGRIIAGTDTGPMQPPGFALHRELGYLSGAGLSNMEVLRAATSRAAEALWRDDLGTIQPGKRADLLLLRRDPLVDLGALRDIERVIHDGQPYDPATLLAQAAEENVGQDGKP